MEEGWNFPTDAFVEILLRIPPSKRRWLRLVCRHWRDVIDERTPKWQTRPKALALTTRSHSASAYVIDDLPDGLCREVWTARASPGTDRSFYTVMVGSCNGLLCLCDNTKPGGAISLVNPVTGETLALSKLPCSGHWSGYWGHKAYSFGYHPVTGRYKIVHLPCYLDRTGQFNVVQVLTVGEASWRDIPAPAGASCCLESGLVSVDDATYWVTKDAARLAVFDLRDEGVASTMPLPVAAGPGYLCHLMEVHGRLGIVASVDEQTPAKIEVWVLVDVRRQEWNRRYRVQVHGVRQQLSRPHFAHGEYVLTKEVKDYRNVVFVHRLSGAGRLQCREVRISKRSPGVVACMKGGLHGMFAYVETTEPPSIYKLRN